MKRPNQPTAGKHYLKENYEDFNLWLDYWYQIKLLKFTNPKKILEIGKGTGTLEALMESRNFNYTTVDIDKDLKPDYVADILDLPFKSESFDTVCAFEVLEHIPFSEFEKALKEMSRVTKKYIVISLPYASFFVSFAFQLFYMEKLKTLFNFLRIKPFEPTFVNLTIPFFFLNKQGMINAHAWEMGRRGHSLRKIRSIFKKLNFKIVREETRIFYPYHRFFVLKA